MARGSETSVRFGLISPGGARRNTSVKTFPLSRQRLELVRAIGSDEINSRLADLTGAHLTAKDFRTWKGTVSVFRHLRRHLPAGENADQVVLAAIDAASARLNNTRTVARAHYVHPEVVAGYTSGELERFLAGRRVRATKYLDVDERLLLAYLSDSLESRAADFL